MITPGQMAVQDRESRHGMVSTLGSVQADVSSSYVLNSWGVFLSPEFGTVLASQWICRHRVTYGLGTDLLGR